MKFYNLLFLPLFSIACLMAGGLAEAAIPAAERDALLALYSTTGGDNWHNNTGWKGAAGTECAWYGVSCDTEQSTITGLDLKANHLKGPLPDKLTQLSHLTSSDFRYNGVYSSNPGLIDFLDATGPVGSVPDTQTLDADGIVFSNVTATGFDVSWNPVTYMQAGGYRIYMAEQIDSESGAVMTDFVQVADIADKSLTTTAITDLVSCRQYFIKVVSYTKGYDGNANEVQSDEVYGPIIGTIPGYTEVCAIIGSSNEDAFSLDPDSFASPAVVITISDSGVRSYSLRGAHVWHLDGAAGLDKLVVLGSGDNTWILDTENRSKVNENDFSNIEHLVGGSGADSFTIVTYVGDTLIIDAGDGVDTLTGPEADNEWSITDSNTGILNSNVNFLNIQNLNGGTGLDIFTFYEGGEISGIFNTDLNDLSIHLDSSFYDIKVAEITPMFNSGPGEHDISENVGLGEIVVSFTRNSTEGLSLTANRFSISKGNEAGFFAIDSDSGAISLVRPLDYETTTRHELEISFFLGEIGPLTVPVIINVTDAAESGGCTLRPGTPFDPLWLLMLVTAAIYRTQKSNSLN